MEGFNNYDDDDDVNKPCLGTSTNGKTDNNDQSLAFVRRMFSIISQSHLSHEENKEKRLSQLNLKGVAEYMKSDKCQKIVVMCGAGISTSVGLPDFRTSGTGLNDTFQKYNLPNPEAIYDFAYFKKNPYPFYSLVKQFYLRNHKPTCSHYFIKLLEDKGFLRRVYTQNFDCLERMAGISASKIVEAHGTFHTAHCINCQKEYSSDWVKEKLTEVDVPHCLKCSSFVKPDIVFFGERLNDRFSELNDGDLSKCDLLIIMGTSLQVQPFGSMVGSVSPNTPRLLINHEKCEDATTMMALASGAPSSMDFDSETAYRDVAWVGDCDEGCQKLCSYLGWDYDLKELAVIGRNHCDFNEKHTSSASFSSLRKSARKSSVKGRNL